jgi:hypothetical protein
MPFPARLLGDYSNRPLAVAIYAITFLAAMARQLVVWLDVTRPERRELIAEPVPDEVRASFGRALGGRLLVFGAIVPVAMFVPRYAALAWPDDPAAAGGGTVRAPAGAADGYRRLRSTRRSSVGSRGRPGCS